MSGYHGTVGATGVGPAVWPEPLRRVLLLAGLVTAILFTVWLSSAPAHAEELSLSEPALPSTGAVVERAEGLGPVGDTVAEVGGHATRAVGGASEAAQALQAKTPDPVPHVHEAVRSASLPEPGGLPETLAPVTGQVDHPESQDTDGPDETGVTTETGQNPEEPEVEETMARLDAPPPHERAVPDPVQATDVADSDDESDVLGPDVLDASSAGGAAPATAPTATGGTATAHAVAGYLATAAAPAPAPGLFEAARHVLRSAPVEPTDESTFSPD
ncbi:hypothetical protein ACWGSK_16390 [Nocardiopsis sp. NPDC055551]|uniref:hypothetical protein n=1 Tax=Nocardiopsis sp. NPDC006832 TaxID=3157188 RepID=UPI0033F22117